MNKKQSQLKRIKAEYVTDSDLDWRPLARDCQIFGDPTGDFIVQNFSFAIHSINCHEDFHATGHQGQFFVLE